jgi:hypothetical protein
MRAGYIAIGLAAVVGVVPASFAQDWRVLSKSAGTAIEDKQRQTRQGLATNSGISVAEPIGSVSLNPELLDGEPIYVRRTTVTAGMTVAEVSTTPFMPVLASNEGTIGRPDQPASW